MAGEKLGQSKAIRAVMRRDRIAAHAIRIGGAAVVLAVVLMLGLILYVTLPLFYEPSLELRSTFDYDAPSDAAIVATGISNDGTAAFTIDDRGRIAAYDTVDGAAKTDAPAREDAPPDARVVASDTWGGDRQALLWSDGAISLLRVRLLAEFETGQREIRLDVERTPIDAGFATAGLIAFVVRQSEEGSTAAAALHESGAVELLQIVQTEDLFGETTTDVFQPELPMPEGAVLTAIAIDSRVQNLYGGSADGRLLRWDLTSAGGPVLAESVQAFRDGTIPTALELIFGDISLAVGDSAGGLATWAPVRPEPQSDRQLRRIHALAEHDDAVLRIRPTRRNKAFFTQDASGTMRYYHMTTERLLIEMEPPATVEAFALSQNAAEFIAAFNTGEAAVWSLEAPHPEVSWQTLFGRVWYENYDRPEFTWQSSAASDDYEPKLSLIPLIFGSFKATVYAMIFAAPLALLGAAYTSQFAKPALRSAIKSGVELMASVPSVIIGFIIALWLAPIIDEHLVTFFSILLVLPAVFAVFLLAYQRFDNTTITRRIERGYEFIVIAPVVLLALVIAATIAGPVERLLFAGDLQQWLFVRFDERYDQRNAIIIAVGLGFAAIPIIFTIAEDALSNLPQQLRAASLALGASRWQTVWRVVMPSASPGIFAAVIIGFGRVIGETMIVLMATGNTPIIDWSPFNGMRTLSANIAVEIPEAPVNGTLYRVLFLSAVLLFTMTFLLNTAAEVIRQRLRNKYGRFQ